MHFTIIPTISFDLCVLEDCLLRPFPFDKFVPFGQVTAVDSPSGLLLTFVCLSSFWGNFHSGLGVVSMRTCRRFLFFFLLITYLWPLPVGRFVRDMVKVVDFCSPSGGWGVSPRLNKRVPGFFFCRQCPPPISI